jgi:hypothetical protein
LSHPLRLIGNDYRYSPSDENDDMMYYLSLPCNAQCQTQTELKQSTVEGVAGEDFFGGMKIVHTPTYALLFGIDIFL